MTFAKREVAPATSSDRGRQLPSALPICAALIPSLLVSEWTEAAAGAARLLLE